MLGREYSKVIFLLFIAYQLLLYPLQGVAVVKASGAMNSEWCANSSGYPPKIG